MPFDRRKREQMSACCGEIHEDDGIDPREFFRIKPNRNKSNYKSKQLCRQVAKTLDQVLAGETGDGVLQTLRVGAVVPAPDVSQLLVVVHADCEPHEFDRRLYEDRLAACKGRLRTEVAAAIERRKTPGLMFEVIGPTTPRSASGEEASR